MNEAMREWIGKDPDRRRIYGTEPIYRAQAQILSTIIDAVDSSLKVSGIPERDRDHAMQAAILAVLGSIESAEQRLVDTQTRIRLSEHASGPIWPPHPSSGGGPPF